MKNKRIFFVVSRMHGGGAQRVIVHLINYMADYTDWDVTLIMFRSFPTDSYLKLITPKCRQVILGATAKTGWLKLSSLFRKEKPDVVLSTLNYINISVALAAILSRSPFRLIVREARLLSKTNVLIRQLQKLVYWRVNIFWAIIPDIKSELSSMLGISPQKIVLAPNPLNMEDEAGVEPQKSIKSINAITQLLYVGRLIGLKNIGSLIRSLALIRGENWHLKIVGKGPLEGTLKDLAKQLQLEHKIEFAGYSEDPYKYMRLSDIFCFPSTFEGFPNVVTEALACGNLCVANDTEGGGVRYIKSLVDTVIIADYNNHKEVAGIISYYINNRTELDAKKLLSAKLAQQLQMANYYDNYLRDLLA